MKAKRVRGAEEACDCAHSGSDSGIRSRRGRSGGSGNKGGIGRMGGQGVRRPIRHGVADRLALQLYIFSRLAQKSFLSTPQTY